MSDVLLMKQENGLLTLTLNRPAVRNALNSELINALKAGMETARDPKVRAVLVTGAGEGFCAGGDLQQFHSFLSDKGGGKMETMPINLHEMIKTLRNLPKPVIAAINGSCAGAGFSLVLACDLAIAADTAAFTLAYTAIGLSPDGSSSYFLPRHIGLKKTMELFLSSKRMDAKEVAQLGLINQVVPKDQLASTALAMAQKLATGPTLAFAKTKELVNRSFGNNLADQLDLETDLIMKSVMTKDFAAGVTAYVTKQTASFVGQ